MSSINQEIQKTELSEYVELWELDLSELGSEIFYFVTAAREPNPVTWAGQEYTPFDLIADGFEWNGQGPIATPTIKFSTINLAITAYINDLGDMLGAKVTRTSTFRIFLDGESDENPNEYFSKDTYRINTKTTENKFYVEFELSSYLDQTGTMLPRGVVTPYCRAIYRKWQDNIGFVYNNSDLACPWQTLVSYSVDNVPVGDPHLDVCNHLTTGCKVRFGTGNLPFMGFPGTQKPTIT